jgi:hypothetical protein
MPTLPQWCQRWCHARSCGGLDGTRMGAFDFCTHLACRSATLPAACCLLALCLRQGRHSGAPAGHAPAALRGHAGGVHAEHRPAMATAAAPPCGAARARVALVPEWQWRPCRHHTAPSPWDGWGTASRPILSAAGLANPQATRLMGAESEVRALCTPGLHKAAVLLPRPAGRPREVRACPLAAWWPGFVASASLVGGGRPSSTAGAARVPAAAVTHRWHAGTAACGAHSHDI